MDHLTEFTALHPEINLDIALSRQIASLDRRETDLSLRFAYEVTEDVVGRKLVTCTRAAYCSPNYAAKIKNNNGLGLFWIGGTNPDRSKTADWIAETSFKLAEQHHFMREASVLIAMAAAGQGLAMLPCFLGDNEPSLVRAPFQKTILNDCSRYIVSWKLCSTMKIPVHRSLSDPMHQRHAWMELGCDSRGFEVDLT